MCVIARAAAQTGLHTALQRPARAQICVPEVVFRITEHVPEIVGGGIETLVIQNFGERHVDVEIVLLDGIRHAVGRPLWERPFIDLLAESKLCGSSEADTDHLAGPTPLDFVVQHGQRDFARTVRLAPQHQEQTRRHQVHQNHQSRKQCSPHT